MINVASCSILRIDLQYTSFPTFSQEKKCLVKFIYIVDKQKLYIFKKGDWKDSPWLTYANFDFIVASQPGRIKRKQGNVENYENWVCPKYKNKSNIYHNFNQIRSAVSDRRKKPPNKWLLRLHQNRSKRLQEQKIESQK